MVGDEVVGGLSDGVLEGFSLPLIPLAFLAQNEENHQNQNDDDASEGSDQGKHDRKGS